MSDGVPLCDTQGETAHLTLVKKQIASGKVELLHKAEPCHRSTHRGSTHDCLLPLFRGSSSFRKGNRKKDVGMAQGFSRTWLIFSIGKDNDFY